MQYDLIIRNGTIIDGSGRKRYQGDIAVRGAVIEEIGNLNSAESAREIDAQGKIVCPGFIDIHSHVDFAIADRHHVARLEPLIRQGITTMIGGAQGKGPFDALCDLLLEENGQVMVFHTPLAPDDPFAFRSMWAGFTHPMAVPATDTILRPIGRPAHVFYDCFPRFIAFFTKEKPLLSLEEAVRKCTALPADIMRIKHRGILQKGNVADITVFDYAALGTAATFHSPAVFPSGIEHVTINGRPVLTAGELKKDNMAGAVIRRTD